jgi:hypothetical protein
MSRDHAGVMPTRRFASDWGVFAPAGCVDVTGVVCPNCGGAASMDRVSNRVFGWHDRCGWQASLRVVRRNGAVTLED